MSAPLKCRMSYLTSHADLDIMHRRAGREARPKVTRHADSHKYCTLGRCGTRPGPYAGGHTEGIHGKTAKIVAWRKAKAQSNRRYLEEKVYGKNAEVVYNYRKREPVGLGDQHESQSAGQYGSGQHERFDRDPYREP